jgi:hypothetical protein
MMGEGLRLRIYESALADVTYLYGRPLPFSPKGAKDLQSAWYQAVREWEDRRAGEGNKSA